MCIVYCCCIVFDSILWERAAAVLFHTEASLFFQIPSFRRSCTKYMQTRLHFWRIKVQEVSRSMSD